MEVKQKNWVAEILGELLVLAFILSTIILVVGNALSFLFGWQSVEVASAIAIFSCLPFAIVGGFLGIVLWRRLVIALEISLQKDINRDGIIGENVRLIPVYNRGKEVDGVPPKDLRTFIRSIVEDKKWSQANWVGQQMPSGRTVDIEYYDAMISPLVKAGFIIDRSHRKTGKLTCFDANEIIQHLGL